MSTTTPTFGSSGRESHNADRFYSQTGIPSIDGTPSHDLAEIQPSGALSGFVEIGDACALDLVDRCAALVVTSPPYFAGKDYETDATWAGYLELLDGFIAEAWRVLEPGGRIAVNAAGIGRAPYIPLPHLIADMLTRHGFVLRGEIVWRKAEGASGSCAWGSFRSASNPTLRDLTERVVVASKGQMARCGKPAARETAGLPHRSTISKEAFLRDTLDVWSIRPESAKRVGHPAPFPVELPQRLIELFTFAGDLVVDPFAGAGTTGVAAKQTGRRFYGVDLDDRYVDLANTRIGSTAAWIDPDTAWTVPPF